MEFSKTAHELAFLGVAIYTQHINPHVMPSDIEYVTARAYRYLASHYEPGTDLTLTRGTHFLLGDLIEHLTQHLKLDPVTH